MKQLLVILVLLCSVSVSAQDVIVKKDGSTVVCRVVELTSTEITYKKWNDQNGSNYIMNRNDASAINYQNGKKVDLSETTNLYLPNNQNDGTQKYNDRALLNMAYEGRVPKEVRKLRTWGWVSAIAGVGFGTLGAMLGKNADDSGVQYYVAGGVLFAGGVATSIYCFSRASKLNKENYYLQSSTIIQKEFLFSNGSRLYTGVDMIHDNIMKNRTIGLGVTYNF